MFSGKDLKNGFKIFTLIAEMSSQTLGTTAKTSRLEWKNFLKETFVKRISRIRAAYYSHLKVSLTIADLEESLKIKTDHLAGEAFQYRLKIGE